MDNDGLNGDARRSGPWPAGGPPPEALIDSDEVSRRLGLPVTWIREEARLGRIPARKFGKYWRFLWSEVMAWRDAKPIRTGPR